MPPSPRRLWASGAAAGALTLAAFLLPAGAAEPGHVLDARADIAQAGYEDSLRVAAAIGGAVAALGLDVTAFDGLNTPDRAFQ